MPFEAPLLPGSNPPILDARSLGASEIPTYEDADPALSARIQCSVTHESPALTTTFGWCADCPQPAGMSARPSVSTHAPDSTSGDAPLHSTPHEVLEGLRGAARMVFTILTPFLRERRARWGLDPETAARRMPGDELVPSPLWSWTHGIEIEASAEEVWPWIAQVGATRGGFYSYAWLENVAGCDLHNAEAVHASWALKVGDELVMHPKAPALTIVAAEPGGFLLAYGAPDEEARAAGEPWAAASWLFLLEPLGERRCRLVSRHRAACSEDVRTRLAFGTAFVEPIGFAMDRRMLLGVKERAERA